MNREVERTRRGDGVLGRISGSFPGIFDRIPIPASLVRVEDAVYAAVNDAWCAFFGFERAQVVGRTAVELGLAEPGDLERLKASFERRDALAGHQISIRTRDGASRVVLAVAEQLSIEGEHYALGMSLDITERQRTEMAVEKHRNVLQLCIQHVPAGLAMFDKEMRYIAVSRRFIESFGLELTEAEMIGRYHYDVFPELPERLRAVHRRCLAGATERSNEDSFTRLDGTVEWARWEVLPWYESSDEIGGILLFTEVITEQKRIADAIQKSERLFRDLFRKHTASKLLVDARDGGIVEANEAAVEFYGWPLESLRRLRLRDLDLRSPRDLRKTLERAGREPSIQFETRHRLEDGSHRDLEVFCSQIDIEGRRLLHLIMQDITERRSLEEQLLHAQKMEAVGRLAGGIAHDFNNLLSVILGYAELALAKTPDGDPVHADLAQIRLAGQRSAELTRQLLAFASQQTIAPRLLDLNATVADMLKMLRRVIGEDTDLAWRPSEGLWPVLLDPAQANQILINLCINARDAITGVGKLTIETANVSFDRAYCEENPSFTPGDYVMLAISDDGRGMDADTMKLIFEPFFTTKTGSDGTGLGLSTVYGIVKQNRGFIKVYSEPDKGTTFKIYLARKDSDVSPPRRETVPQVPIGGAETVLVVEDDGGILALGERILVELGYTVLAATTPLAAIDLISAYPDTIHLLITDVVMPEMNGLELAAQVRTRHPELRTLFMSGYTANVIAHHGVLDAGVKFLEKPFTVRKLAAAVREVLDEHAARLET